jgi:hypothetical protein
VTGSEKCGGVNQAKGIIRVLSVLVWLGEDALGASEFSLKAADICCPVPPPATSARQGQIARIAGQREMIFVSRRSGVEQSRVVCTN